MDCQYFINSAKGSFEIGGIKGEKDIGIIFHTLPELDIHINEKINKASSE